MNLHPPWFGLAWATGLWNGSTFSLKCYARPPNLLLMGSTLNIWGGKKIGRTSTGGASVARQVLAPPLVHCVAVAFWYFELTLSFYIISTEFFNLFQKLLCSPFHLLHLLRNQWMFNLDRGILFETRHKSQHKPVG